MEIKTIKGNTDRESKRNYCSNFKNDFPDGSLYSKEEWHKILSESSNKGIAIIRNDEIIGAGINFAKIVGFEYSEVIGMIILDFVVPQYRIQVRNNFKSTEELSYETLIQRKDGSVLPVVACGRFIPGSDFTIWMVVVKD